MYIMKAKVIFVKLIKQDIPYECVLKVNTYFDETLVSS